MPTTVRTYKTRQQYERAFLRGEATTPEGYRHYAQLCQEEKQEKGRVVVITAGKPANRGAHDPFTPRQVVLPEIVEEVGVDEEESLRLMFESVRAGSDDEVLAAAGSRRVSR